MNVWNPGLTIMVTCQVYKLIDEHMYTDITKLPNHVHTYTYDASTNKLHPNPDHPMRDKGI